GGHMLGLMATDSTIAVLRPEYQLGGNYFTMSGTSQSAALVSGIVALILDDDPTLTPDGVKCRLLASARAALDANDDLAYSIFQQGAGLVHAYDAVYSTASGCANLSLDIATDLAGTAHYGGPARRDTVTGIYYHADQVGYEWDGSFFAGGFPFIEGGGFPFIEGGGFPFIEGGGFPFIEGGGFPFIEGSVVVSGLDWLGDFTWTTTPYVWSSGLMETMSVNQWVPQE
ncbi:MAG: S8 family serine peptidase, partial [bacterium]|nr:S8 family serine peptidase [bacterium]